MLMFDKKRKKKDKQTANEFINIKDVRLNYLYTRDGLIFCFLKVQPINLQLLSKKEQTQKMKDFTAELCSEQEPLKFFSISRPVDIDSLVNSLEYQLENTNNEVEQELLKQNIEETKNLTNAGEVIERQTFIIIWKNHDYYAEQDLSKRANDLINKFANCGTKCELLSEQQIITLCKNFTTPYYAYSEETNYESYIPVVEVENEEY